MRMCVDYTNLNKHSPKDPFGLPCMDEVVNSMASCKLSPSSTITLVITKSL
jgi:hypothetical protein